MLHREMQNFCNSRCHLPLTPTLQAISPTHYTHKTKELLCNTSPLSSNIANKMSYTPGNCFTPNKGAIVIDDLQPICPPPPIARVKFAEIHVPEHQGRLNDAPLGFFLAAPCSSSSSIDGDSDSLETQIKRIKLQPKKSRMSSNRKDHIGLRLQPKRKSIDLTASRSRAVTTTASKHPRSVSAMSA